MSVERIKRASGEVVWRVRWRDVSGRNRSKVLGRKRDAEAFDAEVKRRRRTGELAAMDGGRETLDEYVTGVWSRAHAAHLARRTREIYSSLYDLHIGPRLGEMQLREIDPEIVATFQGQMIAEGVRPHAIQKSMTLLGAILQRAAESRRILYNPQRVVRKARLPHSTEVRPLAPATVERLRAACDLRDATIVSVLAYAGVRPGRAAAPQVERRRRADSARERTEDRRSAQCPLAEPAGRRPRGVESRIRRLPGQADLRGHKRRPLDSERLREVAAPTLRTSASSCRVAIGAALRPAPQLRLPPSPRGTQRDLRGPPTRPWSGADDADLRPRHRGARGRSAAAGRGRHRGSPSIGCGMSLYPFRTCALPCLSRDFKKDLQMKAPRAGFEPAAYSLGGSRSIQLSYRGQLACPSGNHGLWPAHRFDIFSPCRYLRRGARGLDASWLHAGAAMGSASRSSPRARHDPPASAVSSRQVSPSFATLG